MKMMSGNEYDKEQLIDDIASKAVALLTEEDIKVFKEHPNSSLYHFTYGIYIRNRYLIEMGFNDFERDGLSGEIIDEIIRRVVPDCNPNAD
jgi:hypothetical protein